MKSKVITLYELLGLVKNEQAPKKIEYDNEKYTFDITYKDYISDNEKKALFSERLNFLLTGSLDDIVVVLDEEDDYENIEFEDLLSWFYDFKSDTDYTFEKFSKDFICFQHIVEKIITISKQKKGE